AVSILFARASDIPEYVAMGAADMGMTGYDLVCEKEIDVDILMELGFGSADLVLAVPEEMHIESIQELSGKKIGTSYPTITKSFFSERGVDVEIVEVSGACEMTPHVGIADAIVDLTSSGTTLKINHLQVIDHVLSSSVKLIANKKSSSHRGHIMDDVVMAFKSVIDAQNKRYLMMNVPKDSLDEVKKILPGMSGPTVMPVEASSNLVAVHAVVDEMDTFRIITSLKRAGAKDILITPIERLIQ
ncbi:MAG: ATP phosphoribosyltransferase, partial [Methanosarcinales archaeon]|nr:ATP phosphoribosyltransferase [Methanosarcinales archaeon]